MPAKRKRNDQASLPKGKKAKVKPYKMPPPIPNGQTFVALDKTKWKVGLPIGKGGFGEIYAAESIGNPLKGDFVLKVEPQENGPLFSELAFYQRIAKEDKLKEWEKSTKLKYLGIPRYIASGMHEEGSSKLRFMIMDRFGDNIEHFFFSNGKKFGIKSVCVLALRMLECLEYIHSEEYVHADIKGSNILTGYSKPEQVYLVDYGLAYRYCPDGKHKPYEVDQRRAHNGTIEYTSRDAHQGARPSRRGDLEILGYCLLHWSSGSLPWMDRLQDDDYVGQQKEKYMNKIPDLIKRCFHSDSAPGCLQLYLENITRMKYEEKPDYKKLRKMFQDELASRSLKDNGTGLDWLPQSTGVKKKVGTSAKQKTPKKSPKVKSSSPAKVKSTKAKAVKVAVKKDKSKSKVPAKVIAIEEDCAVISLGEDSKEKGKRQPKKVVSKQTAKMQLAQDDQIQDVDTGITSLGNRKRTRRPVVNLQKIFQDEEEIDSPPKRSRRKKT